MTLVDVRSVRPPSAVSQGLVPPLVVSASKKRRFLTQSKAPTLPAGKNNKSC